MHDVIYEVRFRRSVFFDDLSLLLMLFVFPCLFSIKRISRLPRETEGEDRWGGGGGGGAVPFTPPPNNHPLSPVCKLIKAVPCSQSP